ncbi:hypothetical protein JWG45_02155 [Leptospira sp. 201903070]|uniref:LamG-like jellyroll fold domain-containing protein n=1 Tax=Leptospira ainlahdjerensis TaxID=2810033 RepID=A0ABS2UAJ2_9LEPT|nr:LamG-like jellyroll fold domain-containing protein [Leptospira ainlahdjerensis]MBM9575945.1 hypothetical protein [Leptospira ainlahdjerensis]
MKLKMLLSIRLHVVLSFSLSALTFCQYALESPSAPEFSLLGLARPSVSSGPMGLSVNQTDVTSGSTYNFQSVLNGFRSPNVAITITNSSGNTFEIPSTNFITISGTNASDFILTGSPNGTIANGASVTTELYFSSSSLGTKAAILTLQPGGGFSPISINLQGTGVNNPPGMSLFSQFETLTFADSSGNGNRGFVSGNFGSPFVTGIRGNAIRLGYGASPTFEYITIPDSTPQNFHFSGAQAISISSWVRPDTGNLGTIFDKSQNNDANPNVIFDFSASNSGLRVGSWRESAVSEAVAWAGSISSGWHHVACVYDPGSNPNVTLYLDSVPVQTGNIVSTPTAGANSADANIGRFRRDASQLYVGSMDELRIYYPVALSASQIQSIYNSR